MSQIKDDLIRLKAEGRIAFMTSDGPAFAFLESFCNQPADGILYDLNRDEVTTLAFVDEDPKRINDFACAQVIRHLKAKIEKYENPLKS